MAKCRALLVGTGGWAAAHAKAYRQCSEIELVGVCGHRNADRLQSLAAEYGVEQGTDVGEMLDRLRPDVLDISCNPHYRVEPILAACERPFVRLVNTEKPMALVPSEAQAIAKACEETGTLLTVNHQKKYLPAWAKMHGLIADGSLGDLRFLRASCQGNLLEQGTHLMDMVMHFNGNAPLTWIMGQIDDLDGLRKTGASAPDSAIAEVAFANGVRALLEIGNVGPDYPDETNKWHHFGITAIGSQGMATVTLNRTLEIVRFDERTRTVEPSSWDEHFVAAIAAHLDDAARYALDPSVGHSSDLANSLVSFEALMAIYASALHGGRVEFPATFSDSLVDELLARADG
jgi:predicted dehydrogenase